METNERLARRTEWSHYNPVELHFGSKALDRLASLVGHGPVLLVTTAGGRRRGYVHRCKDLIGKAPFHVVDDVLPNPDLRRLQSQIDGLPAAPRSVVAIGGGSVMDSAKVIAAGIGGGLGGQPLHAALRSGHYVPERTGCIVVAIPTTAGSGAEVTPFAAVWDTIRRRKWSLTGPGLFPSAALLDPSLTTTAPDTVTVSSGLDALSQGLEAVWNRNATPLSDSLAVRSVTLALQALPQVRAQPHDLELRSRMMEASLLAGLAISQTRTALAHSISYPITANFGLEHGFACGFTLPAILGFNAELYPDRFSSLLRHVGCPSVKDLQDELTGLLRALSVDQRLSERGVEPDGLRDIAGEMLSPGRASNNLRRATVEDAVRLAGESIRRLS